MPRTPIDYSKSVIYKIQHLEKDELVYTGSTTNFTKRKCNHKNKSKSHQTKLYEMIRENGGWDCFNMIIIKEYPCQTKTELLQEEDRVMRELKTSLNMVRAYTDKKQYQKEYDKKQYEKNKEDFLTRNKEYHKKNKEEISKRKKEYYQKKKNNAINLKK